MLHKFLQYTIWTFIRLLVSTYKYKVIHPENKEKARAMNPNRAFIFAVWHGQVLSSMAYHAWTEPFLILASRSKDGDYAAYVAQKMHYVPVRGSSKKKNKDKGGKEALLEFIAKLKLGSSAGITVDGPKGPNQVCKVGVVIMSKESQAPIVPNVCIANSYWQFNSWDKFKIPKPFTTINVIYGPPILIPAEATPEEIEAYRFEISDVMKKLEADFK